MDGTIWIPIILVIVLLLTILWVIYQSKKSQEDKKRISLLKQNLVEWRKKRHQTNPENFMTNSEYLELKKIAPKEAETEDERRQEINNQKVMMFMLGAAFNEVTREHRQDNTKNDTPQYRSPKGHHIDFDEVEDDKYW